MARWILDASHGGNDPGIIGGSLGKREADIVLEAVLEAKRHLERNGETVILTRDKDINITVEDRMKYIMEGNGDYLITFNMNSNIDKDIKGVQVDYLRDNERNMRLANLIKDELFSSLRTIDLGVKKDCHNIFKDLQIEGVVVYGEHLSNKTVEMGFDGKIFGTLVAKACLALVDKVLLLTPIMEPKKLQNRIYLICTGYYKDFNEAMDNLEKLNKSGKKDAYLFPYEG